MLHHPEVKVKALLDAARARFALLPSSPHGAGHWMRVLKYGRVFARELQGGHSGFRLMSVEAWRALRDSRGHQRTYKDDRTMNDKITKYGPLDQRYTTPQACERIGLKTTAPYAEIRKGLVARKLGRRTYLFESEIRVYLQATPMIGSSPHANQNSATAQQANSQMGMAA